MNPFGAARVERLAVRPEIDPVLAMEGLGFDSGDRELAGFAAEMAELLRNAVAAWRIGPEGAGFLVLAVDARVEAELARLFDRSPTRGYLAQALAGLALGTAAGLLVPETAAHGCTPLADPPPDVRAALPGLGLSFTASGCLSRALAVLTPMPYRGGCEICALRLGCPRIRSGKRPPAAKGALPLWKPE